MQWFEYRLHFRANVDVDTVLFLLIEYGLEGSYYDEPFEVVRTDDGYGYQVNDSQEKQVITFSTQIIEKSQWQDWFGSLGLLQVERLVANEQTGEEWKDTYSPVQVTKNVAIVPIWMREERTHPAPICLYIEPGAAFGTGLHGTTQDCIRLMEEVQIKDKRVVDLGSGSGILSILAKRMGAKNVIAIDLNPSSELELTKNMAFNQVEGIECIIGDVSALSLPRTDIILCNIGLKENLVLLPKITECLEEEGILIASGIIEWGEEEFSVAVQELGLRVIGRKQTEEWVTLLVHRRPKCKEKSSFIELDHA